MRLYVDIELRIGRRDSGFTLCSRFGSSDDLVILFGPSGSGKTLTMKAIAGLIKPDRGLICAGGRVLFDSEAGINLPARERGLGYLFQDYALFPHLTVRQNISFGLKTWWRTRPTAQAAARVGELLELFELDGVADIRPGNISGGQRQRAALARALAKKPGLLLLDEPFSALDTALREKMRSELLSVTKGFGIPAIVITHDHADVDALADTVVEYEFGSVKSVRPLKRDSGRFVDETRFGRRRILSAHKLAT
jgi:molybdate transport system ATP-binding protein